MKTSRINQKKPFSKYSSKINISKYLSKILSLNNSKQEIKIPKSNEKSHFSETTKENQTVLLAKKEMEIRTLKLRCKKLEKENNLYIHQKNYTQNIICNNQNTSSNFPIQIEIKKLWEKFAKIDILNNFIDFENEPEIIYHIISELFLLSYKIIKEKINYKYKEISKIMGFNNNSMIIKDIEAQFKNFIKEHLGEIFKDLETNNFIFEYKQQIKDIFKEKILYKKDNVNKDKMFNLFCEILEQNEFNEMLKDINDLILIIQYNEPSLFLNIEPNIINRKAKLVKIHNKNNYIIPNDTCGKYKDLTYIIILNPPQLKNGIYYFNNLKKIIMPFNSKSSDFSITVEKEEINEDISSNGNAYELFNNDEELKIKSNINKNRLINCFSQKNKNLLEINKQDINPYKIDKKYMNSVRIMSNRPSNEKVKKSKNKYDINDSVKKKYEKFWKTFTVENLDLFKSQELNKKTKKKYEIINISNEKKKNKKITNYIHNRRRRRCSYGLNNKLFSDRNFWSNYISEEKDKNDIKKKLSESECTKNKNELIKSNKLINIKKDIYSNYLKNSIKKNSQMKYNYYKKCINIKKEKKRYTTNITNETKCYNNRTKGILANNNLRYKKGNLLIDDIFNNNNKIKTFESNNSSNNDIKCRIKNFNINYINIGDSGNYLGVNNSSVFNDNNKTKFIKGNNNKNSFLLFPIDDIQRIIENNIVKKKINNKKNLKNFSQNDNNNKMLNKTIKNNKSAITNISLQKKMTWAKEESSIKLYNRKNNSNKTTRRGLIEKNKSNIFPQNCKYYKNNLQYYDKLSKNNLRYLKKSRAITTNNICEYSQISSSLCSASKKNKPNKTTEIIFGTKIDNTNINNYINKIKKENNSPIFIKLLKSKKIFSKNNTNRQYNLLNTRYEKIKNLNESKEKIDSKISFKKDLRNKRKEKKNNKSTLNILTKKCLK